MDIDPAILEAPYYDEVLVDGDVKAVAPLLTLYDGLVVCMETETYAQENSHLVLYYRPSCPYCKKIEQYLKKEKKWDSFRKKDIRNQAVLEELIQRGGKRQVPCLMVNGKAMYESNDILNWLKVNRNKY